MDNVVTLNQLINISDYIKEIADQNKQHNELLSEEVCNSYDTSYIRNNLLELFNRFKSARYLYEFPLDSSIKLTPTYSFDGSCHQLSNVSQVEQIIEKHIDKQLLTTNIYFSIIKVSYKLSNEEVIYLINTFFTHKSEEDIANIIGISKTYLQKIKKSCLVKMWVDLEKYCNEDD